MTDLVKLDVGFQNYDWGKEAKDSFVARMKGLSNDTSGKHYAELWVGTHPNCPSYVIDGENKIPLAEFIAKPENTYKYLSRTHQRGPFKDTIPYLLKILSIRTALSIQSHPCKALAEKLHKENPDKYKDPNHKPELICAISPFEALCCFRSLQQVVRFLKASPELAALVKAEEVVGEWWSEGAKFPEADSPKEKKALKGLMTNLYKADQESVKTGLRAHLKRVKANPSCTEDKVFARVYDQYPDDVGCWMVYILNYVQMTKGQALFLSDSEPHAYISGDGVEIMASSDNVVRAGLTPKWKDVPTLINMLKYDTTGLQKARHQCNRLENAGRWQVQYYQPPRAFPDFSLFRIEHDEHTGTGTATCNLPTIGLGFCLFGKAKVNNHEIVAGECFAVPYGEVEIQATNSRALLFIASMNRAPLAKI
ncbi:mannose-6-phosphate isomerase [Angomonas deanei]|nr:phosphomannose isomerase [Angomonas deanei]EPY33078.1 mannose-6-phosphate isomerase [Angomonas deanei]|eukprot:EPY26692.1 phosphomannose isomerase [Angomonas deanei]